MRKYKRDLPGKLWAHFTARYKMFFRLRSLQQRVVIRYRKTLLPDRFFWMIYRASIAKNCKITKGKNVPIVSQQGHICLNENSEKSWWELGHQRGYSGELKSSDRCGGMGKYDAVLNAGAYHGRALNSKACRQTRSCEESMPMQVITKRYHMRTSECGLRKRSVKPYPMRIIKE